MIDLFGGVKDLKEKLIRAVGNAQERFKEDALRLLRAVRIATQLDFDIEPHTARAMAKHANLLQAGFRLFLKSASAMSSQNL